MMKKCLSGLSLLVLISLVGGQRANAQVLIEQHASALEDISKTDTQAVDLPSPPLSPFPQLATTVTEWIAQIEASRVQIIDVSVEETATGLQVILTTADGELAEPAITVSGDALIAEIPNAVLALQSSDEFQQFEPADGIALVQVTALPNDQVQVVITGTDAAPIAEIGTSVSGLTLSLTPGIAQADNADDALRIVVTGEEGSPYVEPNTATATRTDTPLRDIPQSIQVIPREVLEDQQVIRLNDALRNVSGVVSTSRASIRGQRFAIRGFEDSSILRDGFRLTTAGSNFGFPELTNLESIEVLKGPASILSGSIEPGGVVNLVSKQPLSEPFYALELQAGNRELLSPSLDFSGPLTEDGRLLYRLNALYRTEDSFRDFDSEIERFFIAPTISWQISDRTDLNISFEYIDIEQPADAGLVAVGDEVADIPFDRVIGELDDINQDERLRAAYQFEHRFSERWKLRNSFSYSKIDSFVSVNSFDSSALNEVTGDGGVLIPAFDSSIRETFDLQTNAVGEFNTGSVEHTVLFGVDLFRSDFRDREVRFGFFSPVPFNIFDPVYGTVPRPDEEDIPLLASLDTKTDGLGVYLQDQVTLLDNLKLLAGVRYETVDQEVINRPTDFNPNGSESSLNEDAFTPRIGLVYQPIEELSLYGSYTTSFVPNTATTVDGDVLEPERGEQFEIGAKAELLEGRLAANLAFFELTKENVATTDPDNIFFSVATGEQRSRGIELDIAGEILPGWNIIANYAYIDADITEDEDGNEGNRLRNIPEHNINLWTSYDIQAGPLEGLGFGLGVNYVSERFGDNANSFTADDYFLTNAAVSYQRDNWRAALNTRNLFDIDYIEAAGTSRTTGIDPGEPFTIVGSFSIEF